MRNILLVVGLLLLFAMCSKPTAFMVKQVIDPQTIELEDGTRVRLIGVNGTTEKYALALSGLANNYVYLYDENYDPIKYIGEGQINAYVYDQEENCINDFALQSDEQSTSKEEGSQSGGTILLGNDSIKERISGNEVGAFPAGTLAEMYEKNKYAVFLVAVPQTETTYAQGTGFFVASKGIGVSNNHVFEAGNQNEAIIKTIDNHQYRVKRIIKADKELDYIVFEVENDHYDFPFLNLAVNQPIVGEDVFAIGNPQGLEHTLSKGIVSSYRNNDYMIQTTTEITHGSSGGPLFNMKGEVVGITTSGVGEANLNFAMNIQKLGIKELINR
jgi:serine protease Do